MRVLFVCLGNICRSPMAENVLVGLLRRRGREGWEVDSAGTSAFHVGEPPDPRARAALAERGFEGRGRARQVEDRDFERFDVLFAMDPANLRDLRRRCPERYLPKLRLVLPDGAGVPDPYYGGPEGFRDGLELLVGALDGWLDRL
jgi:protein-tyrosine phosphatase